MTAARRQTSDKYELSMTFQWHCKSVSLGWYANISEKCHHQAKLSVNSPPSFTV